MIGNMSIGDNSHLHNNQVHANSLVRKVIHVSMIIEVFQAQQRSRLVIEKFPVYLKHHSYAQNYIK